MALSQRALFTGLCACLTVGLGLGASGVGCSDPELQEQKAQELTRDSKCPSDCSDPNTCDGSPDACRKPCFELVMDSSPVDEEPKYRCEQTDCLASGTVPNNCSDPDPPIKPGDPDPGSGGPGGGGPPTGSCQCEDVPGELPKLVGQTYRRPSANGSEKPDGVRDGQVTDTYAVPQYSRACSYKQCCDRIFTVKHVGCSMRAQNWRNAGCSPPAGDDRKRCD
jgi:hypothetical protein